MSWPLLSDDEILKRGYRPVPMSGDQNVIKMIDNENREYWMAKRRQEMNNLMETTTPKINMDTNYTIPKPLSVIPTLPKLDLPGFDSPDDDKDKFNDPLRFLDF